MEHVEPSANGRNRGYYRRKRRDELTFNEAAARSGAIKPRTCADCGFVSHARRSSTRSDSLASHLRTYGHTEAR
jgi:hypothetical protein